MVTFSLVLFSCLMLQQMMHILAAPGSVFMTEQEADAVLQRHRRANTGAFEEFLKGNVERECIEEKCSLEEAREAFENDEKTMEFWASYTIGNQCKSAPCQNQGTCEQQQGTYVCNCQPGFTGKNCEIVTARQCELNNGGCMHFCSTVGNQKAECYCATGYKLVGEVKCEPEVKFPCGKRKLSPSGSVRSLGSITTNNTNSSVTSPRERIVNKTTTLAQLDNLSVISPSRSKRPLWLYNTTEPHNTRVRIVGGNQVSPGEIPWQVALVEHSSQQVFCGGSILSELWVITAAHCLEESKDKPFFIRVGELDVSKKENTEQDLEVEKTISHPRYNPTNSMYNHDLALIRLRSPIRFTDQVLPICLGPKNFIETLLRSESLAIVSGWGRLRYNGRSAGALQKIEVPYVDRTQCKDSSFERITQYMFCSGYPDGSKDACQGDSGGPHAMRYHDTWFLTGIVSWGEECAKKGKYGVYTRLGSYYKWMQYVMGITKKAPLSDIEP